MSLSASPLAAFHLVGDRAVLETTIPEPAVFQPALFGAYHDLSRLRTDYPVILVSTPGSEAWVISLSDIIDELLRLKAESGTSGEEIRRQVLALEQIIRERVAGGQKGLLSRLWDEAREELARGKDDPPSVDQDLDSALRDAGDALVLDGEVVACDKQLSVRLIRRAWQESGDRRSEQLGKRIDRLAQKLNDILKVDYMSSPEARKAEQLEGALGQADRTVFDFQAMAKVLRTAPVADPLPDDRRNRIQLTIDVLESQRFIISDSGRASISNTPYEFLFDDCDKALAAFEQRLPEMAALVKAISIAELEIDNHYKETRHDRFFDRFDQNRLGPRDIELFPSYLVALDQVDSLAEEKILRVLRSGLPIKVVAQVHDVLGDDSLAGGQLVFGTQGQQLARMSMGLDRAFVLQAPNSSLYRLREPVMQGVSMEGPALFSVFAGTGYLESAAAAESRAFPCFVHNPSAGEGQAAQFSLAGNPGPGLDWTEHKLEYEDSDHNSQSESTAFTLVDFIASAPRFSQRFACIPRSDWTDDLVPLARFLELSGREKSNRLPYVWLMDNDHMLYRAVVDEKLLDAADRCLSSWHALQERAGINNSHVRIAVEEAKKTWASEFVPPAAAETPAISPPETPVPVITGDPAQETADEPEEVTPSSDDPWIETIRCTTCNECTELNDRMFAYDGEKRAYIADPDAGTFRELVEAAETCQVAIIHPGKPRNPDEPDLEALLERAAPFN